MIPDEIRETIEDGFLALEIMYQGDDRISESVQDARAWLDAQPQIPQIDWNSAPENAWNAVWVAVNPDGQTQWFPEKPSVHRGSWALSGEKFWYYGETIDLPLGIDWRQTLQRRPDGE